MLSRQGTKLEGTLTFDDLFFSPFLSVHLQTCNFLPVLWLLTSIDQTEG